MSQDPCEAANAETQTSDCDSELAPVGKDGSIAGWLAVGGARFGEAGRLVPGSPTPYTVDFFATAFRNPSRGFFAGSACRDDGTAFDELDSCSRVPAIYAYSVPPGLPAQVEEVLGPDSSDEGQPGYVAGIAWISATKAIAVGGSGSYPRRELPRLADESDAEYAARDRAAEEPSAAGRARVWLYESGRWKEIQDLPTTPAGDPMSGLTAVDCSPRLLIDGELCVVAGMRQLWTWHDGRFTKAFTPTSTDAGDPTVDDGANWRFRVRSISFWPGASISGSTPSAIAVTSGCCGATEAENSARVLYFDGNRWAVRLLLTNPPAGIPRSTAPRLTLADSYYAVAPSTANGGQLSVVASPGGAAPAGVEPQSEIITVAPNRTGSATLPTTYVTRGVVGARVSTLRLLAADGDFDRPHPRSATGSNSFGPDGIVDWAVGVMRSTGQGVALTTAGEPGTLAPAPADCDVAAPTECEARDTEDVRADTRSNSLFALDSYALNAFAFVPGGGAAWAVGDRGAIQRLGGEGSVGALTAEPAPDRVGSPARREFSNTAPYDEAAPSADASVRLGEVPALAGRGRRLAQPSLVAGGAPDPSRAGLPQHRVHSIVMSRNGEEGWAIGADGAKFGQGTLFHYDGARWTVCETTGIPGQVDPDSACSSLAGLHRSEPPVSLTAAARVPLERDEDPTNDDEFEVVAIGTDYQAPGQTMARRVVLRYRNGSWSVDTDAMSDIDPSGAAPPLRDVAFSSPRDGWLVASNSGAAALFHFDGEGWFNCAATNAERCRVGAHSVPQGNVGSGPYMLDYAAGHVYYTGSAGSPRSPFIFSLDVDDPDATWESEYDPPEGGGSLSAFSIAEDLGGRRFGWALGDLDDGSNLLRLAPGTEQWRPWTAADASADYQGSMASTPPQLLSLVDGRGRARSVIAPSGPTPRHPLLQLEEDEAAWRVLPAPFPATPRLDSSRWEATAASIEAMAPDGSGGAWLATRQPLRNPGSRTPGIFFYHYTDTVPEPVLSDAPHPIREPVTGVSPGPNGSLWVATASSAVYRYQRATGWERVVVQGWDPGRVVTAASASNAIAVGADGSGVVVGDGGRIANVAPDGVQLDRAAGARVCEPTGSPAPCGTGRDLVAAAAATDGSAMVGGEGRALLWRPPRGDFEAIPKPASAINATFTGIAMPSPAVAFVVTSTGEVFRGSLSGGSWSWKRENEDVNGDLVTLDAGGSGIRLRAIAVGADGRGYAVGDRGLVIERNGDAETPWRRVDSGVTEDLYSVTVPSSGGGAGLIGGELGLVLTRRSGRWEVARTDDVTEPLSAAARTYSTARVVGVALLPGFDDGEVEAWAASQVPGSGGGTRSPAPTALLHYTNNDEEPLLDPLARGPALPDAGDAAPGELSFAVLGRSDCHLEALSRLCIEPQGTTLTNEVVTRRAIAEIGAASQRDGGPDFVLWTGDIERGVVLDEDADVIHRRWLELAGAQLAAHELPLFAALGGQDLSETTVCSPFGSCGGTRDAGGAGLSAPWRQSFAGMAAPWGTGPPARRGGWSFEPVETGGGRDAPGGGAHTHYALDIRRQGEVVARLAVVDNSLRSLAASAANQHPIEDQAEWLDKVLSSRPAGARAIVLSNTPGYSPNPDASGGGVETATDQATFERTLLENGVDVAVAGRLGWNGVYWTLAPGLHFPCPGAEPADPGQPPEQGSVPGCGPAGESAPVPDPGDLADQGSGGRAALATVVASGAGGTFGPVNRPVRGPATEGFWHGYSVVRLDTGDGSVRVEQRPVFEWISLAGREHVLHPGARLKLLGEGREVAGSDTPLRYDEISNYAITHRFDLLEADPDRPWLPRRHDGYDGAAAGEAAIRAGDGGGSCGPYVCLDPRVGSIDEQRGEVEAGDGEYERTFAVAMLSVGDHVATYPMVFEPRPSFRVGAETSSAQPLPPGAPPPPASPAQPSAPVVEGLAPPPHPSPPIVPPVSLGPAASPPSPPTPPSPPQSSSSGALDLFGVVEGIAIAPQTTVPPPPPPPVNPAPPGGARREARQRQAATQKSGADAVGDADSQEDPESADAHGRANPMDSMEHTATRRRSDEGPLAFSRRDANALHAAAELFPTTRQTGVPAWGQSAIYGGLLVIASLVLALGWEAGRPIPGRRRPHPAAAAWQLRRRSW